MDNFNLNDILLLINILIIRHNLYCSLKIQKNKPIIYIKNKSLPFLIKNIHPFIPLYDSNLFPSKEAVHDKNKINLFRCVRCVRQPESSFISTNNKFVQRRTIHSKASNLVTPIKYYVNADICKKDIVKDNKNKIGIYR